MNSPNLRTVLGPVGAIPLAHMTNRKPSVISSYTLCTVHSEVTHGYIETIYVVQDTFA